MLILSIVMLNYLQILVKYVYKIFLHHGMLQTIPISTAMLFYYVIVFIKLLLGIYTGSFIVELEKKKNTV